MKKIKGATLYFYRGKVSGGMQLGGTLHIPDWVTASGIAYKREEVGDEIYYLNIFAS